MDTEQIKRITRLYLQARSPTPDIIFDDKALETYEAIGESILSIEENAREFINMSTVELDPKKMDILFDILDHTVGLQRGSPPKIKARNEESELSRINFWCRDEALSTLPGCDYYARKTEMPADPALSELIAQSLRKLQPIAQEFLPKLNIYDQVALQRQIKTMKNEVDAAAIGSTARLLAEQKLNVLNDINKIHKLTLITIPQENSPALSYCILDEEAGGVTEKIALIHRDKVEAKLISLIESNDLTFADYCEQRKQYELKTNAIIKLPKHGKIKEVQREAMALNLSRMLEFNTAQSTMISHDSIPALFVPFDDIHLLKDISDGKHLQALSFSRTKYTHYATLNAVGEGLQAENFIEDFGYSLGLFYLCSDTDAVGGNRQNKALQDNKLYIFDQVIMEKDKFGLDSRLSMQPISWLTMHTRWDQGRNRTLIEDSSMDRKFESLMQLKSEQPKLLQYCDRVAHLHRQHIKELEIICGKAETPPYEQEKLKEQIELLHMLAKDADTLQEKINQRINRIDLLMLKGSENIDPLLVKQTLILEKLFNKPTLFTGLGRPYRNPWTQRNALHAVEIMPMEGAPDQFKITFDKAIPDDILVMLQHHIGVDALQRGRNSLKELVIQEAQLRALNETILFPEHQLDLVSNVDYLRPQDLDVIEQGYDKSNGRKILREIEEYHTAMDNVLFRPNFKLKHMHTTEVTLKRIIATSSDKGFGMHVLKKFQFDVQQRLQRLIPPEHLPPTINQAFSAALRLDRVSQFNAVVQEAIKHDRITDSVFLDFLDACINKEREATNHFKAKTLSTELDELAKTVMQQLQQPRVEPLEQPQALMRALHVGEAEPDILEDNISPVLVQSELLENERLTVQTVLEAPPLEPDQIDDNSAIPIPTIEVR